MPKYIFMTGGVFSSLGKGLSSASLGSLLQAQGFKVRIRKLDPYLNVDPGTMSPYQHGEVFVTDDGAEADLDLGHYERFTNVASTKSDNITSGKIYSNVLAKERRGDYLGATVQVIPHITDEIKEFIARETDADFLICEIGGTIGDIEGLPFIEAIRQFSNDRGKQQCLFIHVTYVPYLKVVGESKTKPTQHSVKELLSVGIQPDIIICRSDNEIPLEDKRKIALFCNVPAQRVISAIDVDTIYRVPLAYHREGLDREVLEYFNMKVTDKPDLSKWEKIVKTITNPSKEVRIAIVGKYTSLKESYKSLEEAITHGGIVNDTKVKIDWVDAEVLEKRDVSEKLGHVNAIIVPGGFGERGTEGKISAIQYARENDIPYLGICFGMQMAVIETARHVAHIPDVGTSEFGHVKEQIVGRMTEWNKDGTVEKRGDNDDMGGSMRLGSYPAVLNKGSLANKIYGTTLIDERHRHRYEVNIRYEQQLKDAGMIISGKSPDGVLPEIIEIPNHPWFVGVQFHPELKSRPFEAHPLFESLVEAALAQSEASKQTSKPNIKVV